MSTRTTRERLMLLGALCAPVLLVQAARLATGAGTAAGPAHASAAATFAPPEALPARPLTPQQAGALAFIRDTAAKAAIIEGGPMDRAPDAAPTPAATTPTVTVAPAPTPRATAPAGPKAPAVVLTAIVTGRNPLAVINGGIFKVGDEVAAGWRIERIDANDLTVILAGPQGASFTVEQTRGGD